MSKDWVQSDNPKQAALVDQVDPDSPAEKQGFKKGDLITVWAGKKITSQKDLDVAISQAQVGKSYQVGVLRKIGDKYKFSQAQITIAALAAPTPIPVTTHDKVDLAQVYAATSEANAKVKVDLTGLAPPRSPLATAAMDRSEKTLADAKAVYDRILTEADAAYHGSRAGTAKQVADDLDKALKAAMQAPDLNEANRIDATAKAARATGEWQNSRLERPTSSLA